uniref:Rep protein n=1 Tax=Streptococcus pneumoniae TaxID=1313 RepID=A0A4J2H107_STREE|nr:Rep protein [Streptococcus pneumoniae]
MSYNRKIIRTSSYLEIWEYESPIFSNDTTQIDEEHISLKEPKFQVEVSHPKEIHLATCSPSIF